MNRDGIKNRRKAVSGSVVGKSGDKTVKVAYFYKMPHSVYKKEIKRKTILYAHDAGNECRLGDVVSIFETRPLSRLKRWRVAKIIKSASVVDA